MKHLIDRFEEQRQAQATQVPASISSELTARYLADIEAKAYEKAKAELHNLLITTANQAEMEGLRAKLDAMQIAHDNTKRMLEEAQSQSAQLRDQVKAFQAGDSVSQQNISSMREMHQSQMKGKDDRIRELELALAKAESRPISKSTPVINNPKPIAFEFEPTRGPNGIIQSVTAKPIYRN